MKKRGELVWDTLIPWIVAIGVLILIAIIYFGISGKLSNIGEYIKNWLRFSK